MKAPQVLELSLVGWLSSRFKGSKTPTGSCARSQKRVIVKGYIYKLQLWHVCVYVHVCVWVMCVAAFAGIPARQHLAIMPNVLGYAKCINAFQLYNKSK